MNIIDSPQNRQVRLFQSLATAKGRREHGLFAVEGARSVAALIEAGWTPEVGYFCFDLLEDRELADRLEAVARKCYALSSRAFRALSDTVSPQGIAAAAKMPRASLMALPEGPGVFLGLHELRDPGNMGSMIRTADAAAAAGVIVIGDSVDPFAPKVVRAAAGSLFHVPLAVCTTQEFRAWAHDTGAATVATDAAAADSVFDIVFPQRTVLLIGNEAHGLPEALLTASDIQVRIPMPGRAESLNAAVAAGILLYESIRQRY
ncbi:MAG: RNA methyltransferase [Armatimonadetes bacterium]|nr:RNA methyltransferase [Armatimonadota bacterium]